MEITFNILVGVKYNEFIKYDSKTDKEYFENDKGIYDESTLLKRDDDFFNKSVDIDIGIYENWVVGKIVQANSSDSFFEIETESIQHWKEEVKKNLETLNPGKKFEPKVYFFPSRY